MKKIKNKLEYDTEKSYIVYDTGSCEDFTYNTTYRHILYKTKRKRFFLYEERESQIERSFTTRDNVSTERRIIPYSKEEAYKFLENHELVHENPELIHALKEHFKIREA